MDVETELPQLITEPVEWDVTAEAGEASYFGRRAGAHAAGLSAASNRAHGAESMEGD
ncbi:hypothetical protein OIE68_08385 [Nocardia vinacea]|uniref:Uncharacterized protein n=1 Tax=Nocardia vinacea TaxID=96468 RepID=A0ABZ1YQR0_9NOCA|nr:hypothetical protein OIE68_08385 [Nocardia vinacea]